MTSAAMFSGIANRRLILHLDVNRTLIQIDPAGGKTLNDVMNANVASRVLGVVDASAKTWAALPSSDPTAAEIPDANAASHEMFYDDFVDEVLFPKPAEMAQLPPEEARQLWAEVSAKRRQAKHAFTEPGGPGVAYRAAFTQLKAAMVRPDGAGEYHLIPSFFHLLNALSDADWPFAVVFRTFGTDLPEVLEEYHRFVRGDHADFKPSGPRLARAKDALAAEGPAKWSPVGHVHRSADGLRLIWGASGAAPKPNEDVDAFYAAKGLTPAKLGTAQLAAEIVRAASRDDAGVPSVGLMDYYPWWAAHGEHESAAKVFPVLSAPDAPFQVFFDDNIRMDHPAGRSIVDLRLVDGASGAEIDATAAAVKRAFLCTVDPWDAITRPDFFVAEALTRMRRQQASPSTA